MGPSSFRTCGRANGEFQGHLHAFLTHWARRCVTFGAFTAGPSKSWRGLEIDVPLCGSEVVAWQFCNMWWCGGSAAMTLLAIVSYMCFGCQRVFIERARACPDALVRLPGSMPLYAVLKSWRCGVVTCGGVVGQQLCLCLPSFPICVLDAKWYFLECARASPDAPVWLLG